MSDIFEPTESVIEPTGDQHHADQPQDVQQEDVQPQLPDDRFLSYEEIRKLLAMKHDSTITRDDPVLMLVTICNAFLGEIQKLHDTHNGAMTTIITAKTKDYITSVKKTTDAFSETLSQASVEAVRKIFDQHSSTLKTSTSNTRWCALIVAVSALANVIVLALR